MEKAVNKRSSFPVRIIMFCFLGMIQIAGCSSPLGFNRNVHGSGTVVEETRVLEDFTEVVLSEEGDLFIEVGDQEQLVIQAEDNLQEFLRAEVVDNVLDIKKLPENVNLNATKEIRYHLTVNELNSLTVKNSGNVDISEVNTDNFSVRITGSGSVHIGSLKVHRLEIELTSSGNLVIDRGEAEAQQVRLSSSGSYDGRNVASKIANVILTSSGDATLNVLEVLTVDLSSSGDVYFVGDPDVEYKDSSSTGRAKPLP